VRFPDFELEDVGGGTVALGDLLGRPWIAYLARHPG
jgi:peroxiredoxin